MKRLTGLLSVIALGAIGCGDNSKECGEGTTENADGYCVPSEQPPTCTDGTILDSATNSCVIDPNACQGGTVLIGGECVDPTAGLTVDVTEGAEPNGAGFIEDSTDPAGLLTLKPIGQKLVVSGTTNPFRDDDSDGQMDADYDTYLFDVTGPTLLDITSDGVGGTASAFIIIPATASNPLSDLNWTRYGINIAGDMSKRQVFLPTAGTYAIVFADVRSIYISGTSPPAAGAGGAAGNANAKYFATIEQLALPTASQITLTDGVGQATGDLDNTIKFYAAPMNEGLTQVTVTQDNPVGSAAEGITLLRNSTQFKGAADATTDIFGTTPASVLTLGYRTGDTSLIAVDFAYNYGQPVPFTLDVRSSAATALSTNGGTAMAPLISNTPADVNADLFNLNVFYYDVDAADEVTGMNIHWSVPVDALLIDEDLFIDARFTWNSSNGFQGRTWQDYVGLLRTRQQGRHYFLVYAPSPGGMVGANLVATSTIERRTSEVVTKGTPLEDQPSDAAYKSRTFTYAAGVGTDAWQQFNVVGTGTGNVAVRLYDPELVYGRLDSLTASGAVTADNTPIMSRTLPANNTTPFGRILLDDMTDNYFVVVTPQTTTGSTFDLDFRRRPHVDLGSISAGMMGSSTDQSLDDADTDFFLFRTALSNRVGLTVHPDAALLNTRITFLNTTEASGTVVNNGGLGADDTTSYENVGSWTAFKVDSAIALPVGTNTFDVTVSALSPVTYTATNTTTSWSDACTGGGAVLDLDDADEGLSDTLTLPAGFDFFGFAEGSATVSSNGWLSVTDVFDSYYANTDLPVNTAPNGIIAPYWDDLDEVEVCTKTTGSKLTIQWTGVRYNTTEAVAFQAILDGSTNTIEFVYDTNHVPTGGSATIGVESRAGAAASKIGFNTANVITPGAGKLLTPN